jgi:hypothetical protein
MSDLASPESIRKVIEGNMAALWRYVHVESAMGRVVPYEETASLITNSIYDSAVRAAAATISDQESPGWLCVPPQGPVPYGSLSVPLDWAVGRLVERYGLPWHAAVGVTFYVLTKNPMFVTGLEPMILEVTRVSDQTDPDSFTVSLKGIDEFTSREDWDRLWMTQVRPRQELLWSRRGTKPQGRNKPDPNRLRKYLPLYRKLEQERVTLLEMIRDTNLDEVLAGLLDDADQDTIRRALTDLGSLLRPRD